MRPTRYRHPRRRGGILLTRHLLHGRGHLRLNQLHHKHLRQRGLRTNRSLRPTKLPQSRRFRHAFPLLSQPLRRQLCGLEKLARKPRGRGPHRMPSSILLLSKLLGNSRGHSILHLLGARHLSLWRRPRACRRLAKSRRIFVPFQARRALERGRYTRARIHLAAVPIRRAVLRIPKGLD